MQAGEKGIVNTGCTATMEKVLKTYPDGRMDLLTIGRRRFEIILLNDEKPYLRGAVEFFDDERADPIPPEVRKRVMDAYNDIRALEQPETLREPELSDPQLSFQLAQAGSRSGFPPDPAGHAVRSRSHAAAGRVFPQLRRAPAPDPARARGRATNGHAKRPAGHLKHARSGNISSSTPTTRCGKTISTSSARSTIFAIFWTTPA